jgi:hypothetical protein
MIGNRVCAPRAVPWLLAEDPHQMDVFANHPVLTLNHLPPGMGVPQRASPRASPRTPSPLLIWPRTAGDCPTAARPEEFRSSPPAR